jgi:hypothetical protein
VLALADPASSSLRFPEVTKDQQAKIERAARRIPDTWKPPPPPQPDKNWRVPEGTPLRHLFDALRAGNPGRIRNAVLKGKPRPPPGAPDPAYPGETFQTRASGLSKASPDHIIPLAEIVNMPGFTKLRAEYMYVVTRAPINFQWLSERANLSKQSKSVAAMSGVDPTWQAEQVRLQNEVRARLQDVINKLLRIQGQQP